jgi:spore coat protein U-like protein
MTKWTGFFGIDLRRMQCGAMAAVLLIAMWQPLPAWASCSFISVTDVGFGTYNVFDALPNTSGVGSITIKCQGGPGYAYDITLSTGQSHSFASRLMKSGANSLSYNIYTSATRSIVWGDGTAGSSTQSAYKNNTTTLSLFGQIPAGQDVANGIYTDNLIATVIF